MSNLTPGDSSRFTPGRILLATGLVLVLIPISLFSFKAWSERKVEQRWRSEVEKLGARTITAGYENTSSGVGRVPILGELLTHRRQVELFIDDPATVEAVLDKATEFPPLGRVWVDLNVFERSMGDRIKQKMPGMHVVFYTRTK